MKLLQIGFLIFSFFAADLSAQTGSRRVVTANFSLFPDGGGGIKVDLFSSETVLHSIRIIFSEPISPVKMDGGVSIEKDDKFSHSTYRLVVASKSDKPVNKGGIIYIIETQRAGTKSVSYKFTREGVQNLITRNVGVQIYTETVDLKGFVFAVERNLDFRDLEEMFKKKEKEEQEKKEGL